MAKQTFTVGQVLTASQLTSLQATALGGGAASAKSASYTLVSADAGTTISMTSTSATTVTVNSGLFAAGDTVFIQNLGSGVSTITAGTATVDTSSSLALAQYEGGTLFFSSASASLFFKADGAAVGGGGKVLQVVTAFKSDTFVAGDVPYVDITGLSVSITPSANTSKVLVMMTVTGSHQIGTADAVLRLMRGSTAIAIADAAATRTRATVSMMAVSSTSTASTAFTFLDSPATTSATTYKVQGYGNGASDKGFFINRGSLDSDAVSVARTASSITVMEIGA